MPAKATAKNSSAANDRIFSNEDLNNLDAASNQLMCADGVLTAIFWSFDEVTAAPRLDDKSLHEALYAVLGMVRKARESVNKI